MGLDWFLFKMILSAPTFMRVAIYIDVPSNSKTMLRSKLAYLTYISSFTVNILSNFVIYQNRLILKIFRPSLLVEKRMIRM